MFRIWRLFHDIFTSILWSCYEYKKMSNYMAFTWIKIYISEFFYIFCDFVCFNYSSIDIFVEETSLILINISKYFYRSFYIYKKMLLKIFSFIIMIKLVKPNLNKKYQFIYRHQSTVHLRLVLRIIISQIYVCKNIWWNI